MSIFGNALFTSRLELRRLVSDDVGRLVEWSNASEACGAFLTPERYDAAHLGQQIEAGVFWSERERMFLALLKSNRQPIGSVHYWQTPGRKDTTTMAVKIAIPGERGKGYGTEIQKFVIMHLFSQLQVHCIEMYTDINNVAQQRCLNKLGFELVESLRYQDQQEMRTGNLYRLARAQYESQPIYRFHYE